MNTTSVVGVVLSFAFAFALIGAVGLPWATPFDTGSGAERTLTDLSDQADPQTDSSSNPFRFDAAGDNEPSLVGGALSSGDFLIKFAVAVALLPVWLMELGFPNWFAVPIGGLAQMVASIGVLQFVLGRNYR